MNYKVERCADRYVLKIEDSKLYFKETPQMIEVQDIYIPNKSNVSYESLIKACIDLSINKSLGIFFHKNILHL